MSPKKARLIGYGLFLCSIPFLLVSVICAEIAGGLLSMVFLILAAVMFAVSTVWMLRKVRCPHCGELLHLKLYDISRCPYCGKSTDPDDNSPML